MRGDVEEGRSNGSRRAAPAAWIAALCVLAAALLGAPAAAQEPGATGSGGLLGRVLDADTGVVVAGATVTLVWPAPADGSTPRTETRSSGPDGVFRFESIPAGRYTLRFTHPGYSEATVTGYVVVPGREDRTDFPMPPLPFESFVVEATTLDELMASLDRRMQSDLQLDVLSSEDLARYAAGDVAEAMKRVPGVNVVEGQFAIIRGLEDRYSSTLYNGAPVPSPDPDRQSVQLDLFPSEVVNDLVVAKTFSAELPSNSAGGSIDVLTHEYPETFEVKLKGGTGWNTNAWDRFLDFQSGSAVGEEKDGADTLEGEAGGFLGGRHELLKREVRFKALYNWELDTETGEGTQEGAEPELFYSGVGQRPPFVTTAQSGGLSLGEFGLSDGRFDLTTSESAEQGTAFGALGFDLDEAGDHQIDASVLYTRKKQETVELKNNGYLPNFDYGILAERQANGDEIVGTRDFGGYSTLSSWISRSVRDSADDAIARGPLWFASFAESESFERERDLLVTQLNGEHRVSWLEGFEFSWATNYARTTQTDDVLGIRYFFEPCGYASEVPCAPGTARVTPPTQFPVEPQALGPGIFAATDDLLVSNNDIEEKQGFGRFDAEYERAVTSTATLSLATGFWYEHAERDVDSSFLETASAESTQCGTSPRCSGSGQQFVILGPTPQEIGETLYGEVDTVSAQRDTTNNAKREITAWNLGGKATLFEDLDLLGGFRVEKIFIESLNDAFTGELTPYGTPGAPRTFPVQYLFFDRLDNPNLAEVSEPERQAQDAQGAVFNDQVLGFDVPVGPCAATDPRSCVDLRTQGELQSFVNGEIDEDRFLPSFGLSWRPLGGLTLRAAWSQTVARPSFREMGYYVTLEPGSDDRIVGNPQLGLSDVESWDGRVEYLWGEHGDLFAFSSFYKEIDDPIESLIVRDPTNAEVTSSALFRTFFNNPSQATLWGIEVEARKNFDFLGEFGRYFSIGGNFTYIDARVDRTDAELGRSLPFFGTLPGDPSRFSELDDSRRLFGQPEWIANGTFAFEQPDWGTRLALAVFGISDVLDAAGGANLNRAGALISLTADRYVDSYYQLDLIASQSFSLERLPGSFDLPGDLTLRMSAKNLTDTTRALVYDPDQTHQTIEERSQKLGTDFDFTLTWAMSF